uniref:AT-rich interactive domain-containing protein 1 n=1 Tax=Erigeron canadensis TaxID=72917 RepID=UPI001CB9190B|nr:AT-rich interactive domain-containing protein 1 [Erigeron canadensis]
MAGWLNVTDGPALDILTILEEIHKNGDIHNKFGQVFDEMVSTFLKEICHVKCFRPFPPMLGDGKSVDLLRLYLCVRDKGGYQSVTENGIWDLVAKDIGCDSDASASLKVVYVKYLELLEVWFCKVVKHKDTRMKVFDPFSDAEMKDYTDVKDLQSCVGSVDGSDAKDGVVIESGEENELSRKRKRERYLPLLDWVKRVSKDPCDPAIGLLPERNKWKLYESEYVWKQALTAREALLLKPSLDPKARQIWKKNLRMHPAMYDDQTATSRCSQRLISAKETQPVIHSRKSLAQDCSESSSTGSPSDREDEDCFRGYNFKQKRTPLGRNFQAKVPEWMETAYEPEAKWLGTPIWPLEKTETRSSLIELERVGKGRQDSCGCQFMGSSECVRFHIYEKGNRIKLELGSAFYKWKFDDMGEKVALTWTPSEEKIFEDIIKANPVSLGITFWDDITSHFKSKSMAVLVSYYFNVYLLRRRAHQNRSDPSNIDSDDDELEKFGSEASNNAPGSIFCSPKKVHLNVR